MTTAGVSRRASRQHLDRKREGAVTATPLLLPTAAVLRNWAPPVVGLILWILTISTMDPGALGSYGLLPEFPVYFWAALGITTVSLVALTQAPRLRQLAMTAHLGVLVLILYATSPAIESVPHYTFVYKHIGIVEYIERYGSVDRSVDIYHRWPGFFSLSAFFSQNSGFPNPISYAAWAEPLFCAIDALLVFACIQAVSRSARTAWLGVTLFTLGNWIGQDYFSPQAFGYVLMLGVLLLVLVFLQGQPVAVGRWLERVFRRLFRVRVPSLDEGPYTVASNRLLIAALALLFDAVLAASHQLTPYVLLLQLGGLMIAGYLRPWWLALGAGAVTIGYLIPNLSYVVNTFGLLDAPDPLANATSAVANGTPIFEGKLVTALEAACFLSVFVLALIGIIRRARRGYVRSAVVVAVLAFASPALLVGQSYGGEARLRVLLYTLPWGCTGACWVMSPENLRRVGVRVWAPFANAAFFCLVFVFGFFGHEDQQLLTPAEIGAAAFLSDPSKVAPDSVILTMVPNFPDRYGPLYFRAGSSTPALSLSRFGNRPLLFPTEADVDAAAADIRGDNDNNGYLVFSRGQSNWARDFQLYPPFALNAFESEVARSPRFKIIYNTPTARIYELVK